jgi:tetratricopeptide (TPR) repeat protein
MPAALQFFARALELWPEEDPDWPGLVLRHAKTDMAIRQQGDQPLVERALERMLAADDIEQAAEAEVLLAECDWFAGRSDSTFSRLEHARRLIADRPASASKTKTYAETSRFLMLANRNAEAVEVGREGLALAKELGLRDLQAHALNNVGVARANSGDMEGIADLDEAFAIAEAIKSPEALRALGNKASMVSDFGDLRQAHELYEQVVELSQQLGISGFELWCDVELAQLDYLAGSWDAASQAAEAFLASVDAHYMETLAHQVRAEVMIGRGDADGAIAESELAVAFARNAKDPQVLYPTLATHAWLLALARRSSAANEQANELVALVARQEYHANRWTISLAFSLDELGRQGEASNVFSQFEMPTRWRTAALAYTSGDRIGAADILGEMGNRSDEAYARLRAAEDGAGVEQLRPALALYREVGATAYLARAEALLRASA